MQHIIKRPKPVVLCILDGWGESESPNDNAIYSANTPCYDNLVNTYPHSQIKTSGLAVGLPEGQMGNSEVGHMNIGGGRIMMQDLPKINEAILDGSFEKNPNLQKIIKTLTETKKTCHIMGLVSDGGVHSHIDHIIALIDLLKKAGIKVKLHSFLDGRDTPPKSALKYLDQIKQKFGEEIFATISGRYYAMDRDNRWERVKLAYDAIRHGKSDNKYDNASSYVERQYSDGNSDEFILPAIANSYTGIEDGDALLMANFRADRARQILTAFVDPKFSAMEVAELNLSVALGMVEYSKELNNFMTTMFPPEETRDILGQVISENGLKQLRIAETEKYAHVTFFFNCGVESLFEGEERILVPSPKVATYDLQPEMSAYIVTDKIIEAIDSDKFDLIVVNYANTDMVGHSGDTKAAILAVEAVDKCLERLSKKVLEKEGTLMITADHGNAEMMCDPDTGAPHTAHTTNDVPFILISSHFLNYKLKSGKLCDIAPTILDVMGIAKPVSMTGNTLIE